MPSKKKKYNARFPAGRIKKIMQTDEEVGKVAQAVPVIISRTLELFVESLLKKSMQITLARNAKTLTPSHMKQCILSENRFDFLKDLVKDIPDASIQEDDENNEIFEESLRNESELESVAASHSKKNLDVSETTVKEALKLKLEAASEVASHSRKRPAPPEVCSPLFPQIAANYYTEQGTSTSRKPVIQYGPKTPGTDTTKLNFSVNSLLGQNAEEEPKLHITIASEQLPSSQHLVPSSSNSSNSSCGSSSNMPTKLVNEHIPPLIPLSHTYGQSSGDNLSIDEDYDN